MPKMIELIAISLNTGMLLALIHVVWILTEAQSDYEAEQKKQSWRISNLELDMHKRRVKEQSADNDNACS